MAKDNGKGRGQVAETAPDPSFKEALSAAIEMAPFSREELARRIGRSGAAISQWLNKGDMPDLAIVFKLEDALDLRLGALVRHHSPDVWLIIETKARSNWKSRTWEQKVQEGLLDGPLDNDDRKMILGVIERLTNFNLANGR